MPRCPKASSGLLRKDLWVSREANLNNLVPFKLPLMHDAGHHVFLFPFASHPTSFGNI